MLTVRTSYKQGLLKAKTYKSVYRLKYKNYYVFCIILLEFSLLKRKRNPSNYFAGQLLQPSVCSWLEKQTSVRCTNEAASAHLSPTSQN